MVLLTSIKKKLLEKQLKSANDAVRLTALENLREFININSTSLLIQLLNDPNTQIKELCLQILKKFPSEQAIEGLILHLLDPTPKIRATIIEIMHEWDSSHYGQNWNEILSNLNEKQKENLFQQISRDLKNLNIMNIEILILALGALKLSKGTDTLFDFLELVTNDLINKSSNTGRTSLQLFDQQNYIRNLSKIIRESIIQLKPSLNQIMSRVQNKNPYFRKEFIELLRLLPTSDIYFEIYIQLLEDQDIEIHKVAIVLIGHIKNTRSIVPLIKSITPNMPSITIETLRALSFIDPLRFSQITYRNWTKIYSLLSTTEENAIIPPIFEYLINWNEKARLFAEEILKNLTDLKYLPILEEYLQRPEQYVKTSVLRILKAWKHPNCLLIIYKQFILTDWTRHDELINTIQEMDINRFRDCDKNQIFKRMNFSEREFMINFINEIQFKKDSDNANYFLALIPHNTPVHEDSLISLIEHPNIHIAEMAIQTLGEIKSKNAITPLIKKLSQFQRSLKLYIIQALGKIQDPIIITPLILCFEDSDQFLNRAILSALSQFDNKAVENQLIQQIKNRIWNIRQGVAYSLGAFGSWQSVPALIILSNDENLAVRRMAIYSLGEIRTDESLNHLKSILIDQDENIRVATLISLGKFAESKVHQIFLNLLSDPNQKIYQTAAIQLGKFGDPTPLIDLKHILNDDSSLSKKEAIHALTMIATTEAVQILLNALEIPNPALNEYIIGAINQLLEKIPSITLPLLHKYYRKINRSIPECYHLYEILPSLTGYRLYQFASLDPGSLLNEWLRSHFPLALQILEEYGIEAEPYLVRILEQIPSNDDHRILDELLQRIRRNNRIQTKEDFYFLL